MKWNNVKELPPINRDSVSMSDAVAVTFDGKKISAIATYDYDAEHWFTIAGGDFHMIDEPLAWAYPVIPSEEEETALIRELEEKNRLVKRNEDRIMIYRLMLKGMGLPDPFELE